MTKGTILILILFISTGCGVVKRGTIPWDESAPSPKTTLTEADESNEEKKADSFVEPSQPPDVQEMQQFLQLAYQDWKGTPYLLGGAGYNGIDCSAFMQVVFEDYFSLQIPRTTREQLQIGKEVKRAQTQTGDLVFFKTGRTTYHVGVMINSSEFLHASTSNGVKISELSYPFWQETYLATKRIF
jgi:cell wall-associated NlpC family hydrolase